MRDRASATHYTEVYLNEYIHGGAFAPVSSSICVVIFTRCNNFQLRDLMAGRLTERPAINTGRIQAGN